MRLTMQTICSLAFLAAVALGATPPSRADEKPEIKAILDKAVASLGGEANLAKYKAATWKEKMKVFVGEMVIEGRYQVAMQWPGCYRLESQSTENRRLSVFNGAKGWEQTSDGTVEMDKRFAAAARGDVYLRWIPVAILPLREKAFKLEQTSEEKIGDRPAVGIQVTPPDSPVFRIYFDKESGLPVRITMKVKDEDTGEEWVSERLYSNYKEIQGIKKAMKMVVKSSQKGSDSTESEITEFKFAEKLDDKMFAKP
jgi:outer membrane lipoprotein-sorting protein